MTPWTLPGYDVTGRLGAGRRRDLWRAVDQATGEVVLLRRLPGVDPAALADLTSTAALVSEHLVRVRATVPLDDGVVLVLDHAEHGGLDELLRRRTGLSAGEVVTVIAPLAAVLAHAHGRGLMHGRVDASAVLIGRGGRPLFDGLGLGAIDQGPRAEGPAGDVRALADLAADLLASDASPEADRVRSALSAATAAELAERVLTACPAAPLEGLTATPVVVVAGGSVNGGRGFRRTGVVVLVLGVLVGLAVVRKSPAPTQDWRQVVVALDAARARAFATADPTVLDQVYVEGSTPALADAARVRLLRGQGQHAAGVRHQVEQIDPVRVGEDQVELRVTEQLQAHQVQDAAGQVVTRIPAGAQRQDVLVLARTPAGWRVREVR